jgi:hypothetical protein
MHAPALRLASDNDDPDNTKQPPTDQNSLDTDTES